MSKKRPRPVPARSTAALGAATVKERPAQWWEKRVFKNTYTHNGRLVEVKGWSVKIQHQGRRRTFSLTSRRRADAAREAAQLYQQIVKQGWPTIPTLSPKNEASTPGTVERSEREVLSKLTARYWENRLLQRRYPHSAIPVGPEWSVRIEHEGVGAYFPLGTSDTSAAAAKALAIYKTVVGDGWEAACQRHPREITLAIHWVSNPVAWTYTTIHSEMLNRPVPPVSENEAVLRVVLVEPDAGIRRALQRWIEVQPAVRCVATCASAEEAFQRAPSSREELWMISRTLPGAAGTTCLERIQQLSPGLCGLLYSVYEDSGQLFAATPGGAAAYLLRRTPPEKLFDPFGAVAAPLSQQEILLRVRNYFQGFFTFAPTAEANSVLENLTNREREILQLLSKGYVDKEVATRLGISAWTVHGHVKNIFEKLHVHTRTEAVVKFLQK